MYGFGTDSRHNGSTILIPVARCLDDVYDHRPRLIATLYEESPASHLILLSSSPLGVRAIRAARARMCTLYYDCKASPG